MKPGLYPKTGHSLKDTFIMLLKCLVLTFSFMFIGLVADTQTDKVDAAYFEMQYVTSSCLTRSGWQFTHDKECSAGYYIVAQIKTTDSLASSRTLKVTVNNKTYTWSKTAVNTAVNLSVIYNKNVSQPIDCGYNNSSVCSNSNMPSGFSYKGGTLILPTSYMQYKVTFGGGGKYLGSDYTASNVTATIIDDYYPSSISGVTVSGSSTSWTKSSVSVSVSGATDLVSAVTYKYGTSAGMAESPSSLTTIGGNNVSVTFTTEQDKTYHVYACDASNNCRYTEKTFSVRIDKTAPTVTGTFAVVDGDTSNNPIVGAISGYTNSKTIRVSSMPSTITDSSSGIAYYEIKARCDTCTTKQIYAKSATKPTTSTKGDLLTTEATWTVELLVYDAASNITKKTFDITYDASTPEPIGDDLDCWSGWGESWGGYPIENGYAQDSSWVECYSTHPDEEPYRYIVTSG